MRKLILSGIPLLLALLALPAQAECYYTVIDRVVIEYTDGSGNVLGTDVRYFFGWSCYASDGTPYDIPDSGANGGGGGSGDPSVSTPSVGCQIGECLADCDLAYELAIEPEVFPPEYYGGAQIKPCGIVCQELATSNRNACYGECASDCN